MVEGKVRSRRLVNSRGVLSEGSVRTSKTYISKLEKEIGEEKEARKKLEREIEELKKMNSEIS